MPKLYEILSPSQQLRLAVQSRQPAQLAMTFAAFVGQFYDRSDFDRLARQASDLYCSHSPEHADLFRARLDRRLHDRYRDPVAWEVAPPPAREAA